MSSSRPGASPTNITLRFRVAVGEHELRRGRLQRAAVELLQHGAQFVERRGVFRRRARRHGGLVGRGRGGSGMARRFDFVGRPAARPAAVHGPAARDGSAAAKRSTGCSPTKRVDAGFQIKVEQVARRFVAVGGHDPDLSMAARAIAPAVQKWNIGGEETAMTEPSAREAMEFDVVIVGAGPAGLSAAIRLKQLNPDIAVVIVEKGSEVGAHILSGAVIDPVALDRLLPEWRGEDTPVKTTVTDDRFYWLIGQAARCGCRISLMPPLMNNHGNFIVSLGSVCRWLASKAEALGVEIYPGFAAAEVLFGDNGAVAGVATGDMGVGKDGEPKDSVHPRHGAARQIHAVRGRRARQSRQAADRQIRLSATGASRRNSGSA